MRPMKIEADERNASDVAELVVSEVRNREVVGKGGTEKPGDEHLGGLNTTYLRTPRPRNFCRRLKRKNKRKRAC